MIQRHKSKSVGWFRAEFQRKKSSLVITKHKKQFQKIRLIQTRTTKSCSLSEVKPAVNLEVKVEREEKIAQQAMAAVNHSFKTKAKATIKKSRLWTVRLLKKGIAVQSFQTRCVPTGFLTSALLRLLISNKYHKRNSCWYKLYKNSYLKRKKIDLLLPMPMHHKSSHNTLSAWRIRETRKQGFLNSTRPSMQSMKSWEWLMRAYLKLDKALNKATIALTRPSLSSSSSQRIKGKSSQKKSNEVRPS